MLRHEARDKRDQESGRDTHLNFGQGTCTVYDYHNYVLIMIIIITSHTVLLVQALHMKRHEQGGAFGFRDVLIKFN